MISKEELLAYIESTSPAKTRQLAMVMCNMMSDEQLNALSSRFTKKIDFTLQEPKKAERKKAEPQPEEEEEEPQPDPMAGIDLD